MRMDVRTDGHEDANSRFRNFANAPKNDVLECLTGILYSMQCNMYIENFLDVFLTVHHSIDFSKYQLSAQFF